MRHQFQWTGQYLKDGREIDLTQIPCAAGFGVSDCWPCSILPGFKRTLEIILELFCEGRATVMVFNTTSFRGTHSGHCSSEWWGYEDKEHDEMIERIKEKK
jgi:hypothetical protein